MAEARKVTIKLSNNWLFCFIVIFLFAINIFSVIPALATMYQPGETLNPDCAPTSTSCGVVTTTNFITASSTDTLINKSGNISQWTNDSGYITTTPNETDPTWNAVSSTYLTTSSAASTYATTGSLANYLTQTTASSTYLKINSPSTTFWDTVYGIVSNSSTFWNTAYSWGNHASAGYLTSSSSSTLTNKSGLISMWANDIGYITSSSITSSTYWDQAYSWGNHADAHYLTSFTEADPIWMAASSSYLTINNASSTYLKMSDASGVYLTSSNASSTYLTITNAVSTYLTSVDASNNYITTSSANNYLTITTASSTYLKTADAASTYLTAVNASNTYLTTSSAASTYLTSANAVSTYLTQASASANYATTGSLSAYLTTSSAANTYLTQTTASATYLPISSSTDFITDGNTNWNNTYGFITSSSPETLTNKSGSNLMWVNDAGYITSSSVASSTYWDTAYSWGNHALVGYLTTSTGLTINNFASPNISQWTNDAGYITTTLSHTQATSTITGVFDVANGGTGTSTFASNGIVFSDGTKLTQSSNLVWDGTNLGVGASSPSNQLTIGSAGGQSLGFQSASNTKIITGTGLRSDTSFDSNLDALGGVRINLDVDDNSTNDFRVLDGDNNVRLLVKEDGSVGIGTTNPGATLDVSNNSTGGWAPGPIRAIGSGTEVGVNIANTGAGGKTYSIFSTGDISWLGQGKLIFADSTSGTARIAIDSVGNVGIGTTDPTSKLTVVGDADISGYVSSTQLCINGDCRVAWQDISNFITSSSIENLTNKSGLISMWSNNVGFITSSSAENLTNKTGNISMWTNNEGYVTSSIIASSTYWNSAYNTITNSSTNWNTAYSWGNHADAHYLTSYTESDPFWMMASSSYLTTSSAASTYLPIGSTFDVAHGGTGLTTLSVDNLLLGNGTSSINFVAPGAGYLQWTGSAYTWSIPAGSGSGNVGTSTIGNLAIYDGTNSVTGTSAIFVSSSGQVMIGTQTPYTATTTFTVNGALYADHIYTSGSSFYVNGKKVISDESNTLSFSASADQNMHLQTLGAGQLSLTSAGNTAMSGGSIAISGTDLLSLKATGDGASLLLQTLGTGSNITINSTSSVNISAHNGGTISLTGDTNITGALTVTGNVSGTWAGNIIPITKGGTGSSTVGSAGSIVYSDGSNYNFSNVGSAGQLLQSNATGAPTWVNTSSLGFGTGSGTVNSGNAGQVVFYSATGTAVSGTSSIYIASDGKIGIGTTAPITELDVYGTGYTSLDARSNSDSTYPVIGTYRSRAGLTAVQTGDVLGRLDFAGRYDANSWVGGVVSMYGKAAENWASGQYGGYLTFETTPIGTILTQERMRIDSTGNIGIGGATSPNYTLQIGTGTITPSGGFGGTNASVKTLISDTTSGKYTQLAIQGPTNGGAAIEIYNGSGVAVADFGMNTNGSDMGFINRMASGIMQFYTDNGASLAPRIYIGSTGNVGIGGTANTTPNLMVLNGGNVGIGTTSPAYKLQVVQSSNGGDAGTFPEISVANSYDSTGINDFSFAGYALSASNGDSTSELFIDGSGLFNNGTPDTYLRVNTNHPLLFGTNLTERMRISAGGNVGIGTTSPAYKLDVYGDINTTGTIRLSGVDYGTYFPYLITSAGTSGQLWQSDGSGAGAWANTSSLGFGTGTVNSGTTGQVAYYSATGTAVSGNSSLYISSDGKVGINTTAPSEKLHIDSGNVIITGSHAGGTGNDSYTKLLLHADDPDNNFIDDSSGNKEITHNGDVTQTSTQYEFGGKSAYFDGTGDFLTTPNSSDFDFGTGDFTVDVWVRLNSYTSYPGLVSGAVAGGTGWILGLSSDGKKVRILQNVTERIVGSITIPLETWTHIALVRYGNTVTVYVNGVSDGAYDSTSVSWNSNGAGIAVGRLVPNFDDYYLNGWIDEVRISKGIARWTSNFTSPSASYGSGVPSGLAIGTTTVSYPLTVAGAAYITGPLYDNSNSSGTLGYILKSTGSGFNWAATSTLGFLSAESDPTWMAASSSYVLWNAPSTTLWDTAYSWGDHSLAGYLTTSTGLTVNNFATNTISQWINDAGYATSTVGDSSQWTTTSSDIYYTTGKVGIGTTTMPENLSITGNLAIAESANTPDATAGWGKIYATAVSIAGPVDSYTKLLLHADGLGNTFVDSAFNNNDVTAYGHATQTTTQYKFGSESAYFDGNGDDYLSVPDSADWDLGSSDFTVDAWIYSTGFNDYNTICFYGTLGDRGWSLQLVSDDYIKFYYTTGGSGDAGVQVAYPFVVDTWYHVAVTRTNGKIYFFVNGSVLNGGGTAFTDITHHAESPFVIGRFGDYDAGSHSFKGYIDEFRLSKGIARWTSDFSTSSVAYGGGQLFYKNSLGDEFALTNTGSAVSSSPWGLDGSSAYYNFGNVGIGTTTPSSKLTVSGDAYITGALYDSTNSSGTIGYVLMATASGTQWVSTSSLGIVGVGGSSQWSDGSGGIYYNSGKVSIGTSTLSENLSVVGNLAIAESANVPDATAGWGKIYATAPSAYNPIDSSTALMLHADDLFNAFVDSVSSTRIISAFGNAIQSATQSKFGGKSAYFDGTGDYLTSPDSEDWELGSSDFTIDFWLKTDDTKSYSCLITRPSESEFLPSNYSILMNQGSANGVIALWSADFGGLMLNSITSVRDNVWHHIAVVRNGTTWKLYVDGIVEDTETSGITIGASARDLYIGTDANYGGRDYTGYIDELRISKGIARWTSDFTTSSLTWARGQLFYKNSLGEEIALGAGNGSENSPWGMNGSSVYYNSGNVGIGTSTPSSKLTVSGDAYITGALYDSTNSSGTIGYILMATASGTQWVSTSSLGIVGGSGSSQWSDGSGGIYYNAGKVSIGTSTLSENLSITGNLAIAESNDIPEVTTGWGKLYAQAPINDIDASTTLLLEMDGVNNIFVDNSSYHHAVVANSSTYQTSENYKLGGKSMYVNGGYLTMASSSDWNFGTEDFTIDFWVYFTGSGGNKQVLRIGNVYSSVYITLGSNLDLYMASPGASSWDITEATPIATTPSLNAWHHVAVARQGTYIRYFYDGSLVGTVESSASLASTNDPTMIGYGNDGEKMPGYIDEFRISKGVARWTDTFTPPNQPYYSRGQLYYKSSSGYEYALINSGGDAVSSSPWGLNGSSVYYNGGNVGIGTTTPSSKLTVSGDAYITGALYDSTNSSGTLGMVLQSTATGTQWVATSSLGISGGSSLPSGTDGQILVNIGGTWVATSGVYINSSTGYAGLGTTNPSELLTVNGSLSLAELSSAPDVTTGFGKLYLKLGTPEDASTTLLLHMDGDNHSTTFTDSSLNPHSISANGNAKISSSPYKFGYGSGYLDGTGDYLTTPNSSDLQFSTGDFTVDMWVFPIAHTQSIPCLFGNYDEFGTGSLALFAGHSSANTSKYQVAFNGVFPAIQSTDDIIYNAWSHIALVRSDGLFKLYVNGILEGSYSNSSAITGGSTFYVGTAGDNISNTTFNGYVDELRISKGVARWTSTFTLPTLPYSSDSSALFYKSSNGYVTQVGGDFGGGSSYPWNSNATSINYNGGNVGIGTSTPSSKLSVTGDVSATGTLSITGTGTSTFSYGATFATAGGFVGIGTANPTALLQVNAISSTFYGSGGTQVIDIATSGVRYRIHTFTTSGTFVAPSAASIVEVLVVAGGGGGGTQRGGGGGAGGMLASSSFQITPSATYSVTVGAGGASDTNGNSSTFSNITAVGGGKGGYGISGSPNCNGGNGGSGGGAAECWPLASGTTGTGIGGQGNDGGANYVGGEPYNGGGGGGAGDVGVDNTGTLANGGDGLTSSITGVATYYAGGGGCGGYGSPGTGGIGGEGGGGNGTVGNSVSAVGASGTPYTGGGGGGGGNGGAGGPGGSGVVIVRYVIPTTSPAGVFYGSIGLNTSAPTADLDVNGTVRLENFTSCTSLTTDASGNLSCGASDQNLKTNILSVSSTLDSIMQLNPVTFQWNDSRYGDTSRTNYGLIAQQVEIVFPNLVSSFTDPQGTHKTVNYDALSSILVKGIQEQQIEIDNLKLLIGASTSTAGITLDDLNKMVVSGGLEVDGHVAFGKDTVGEVTVLANTTSTVIAFDEAYTEKPIITISLIGDVRQMFYSVRNITSSSFEIMIDPAQATDTIFSWHAFAKKGDVFVMPEPVVLAEEPVESPETSPEVSTSTPPSEGGDIATSTPPAESPTETPPAEIPPVETPVVEPPAETTPPLTVEPPAETPPAESTLPTTEGVGTPASPEASVGAVEPTPPPTETPPAE